MRQAVIETVMSNLRDGWRRNVDEILWQHVLYLPTEMFQPVGQFPVISQMILVRTECETIIPDSKTFTISGGLALTGRYPGGGKSSQRRDLDWLCYCGQVLAAARVVEMLNPQLAGPCHMRYHITSCQLRPVSHLEALIPHK